MAGKITIVVLSGTNTGKTFDFDQHETFIVGRDQDCHICIKDDRNASRHHFFIELSPPLARLRDLGSLNGTKVNGKVHGRRRQTESREEAAQRRYPEVEIHDGDTIAVGKTKLRVRIAAAAPVADEPPLPTLYSMETATAATDPMELLKDLVRRQEKESKQATPAIVEIPGYEIDGVLGEGSYGRVYRARSKRSKEAVAIKVMLAQVAVDETARKLFDREMRTQGALTHPNIVGLREQGSVGKMFYFVMDVCEHGSVEDLRRRQGGKLHLDVAAPLVLDALDGLAFAHAKGIVHRDIKPGNLLIGEINGRRQARVSDFGLAKNFQKAGLSGMTMTGSLAGTPHFMPCEQITNFRDTRPPSDVYSMAGSLYLLLTGAYPLDIAKGEDFIEAILNRSATPILNRGVKIAPAVAGVIDRALSKSAGARYKDARQLRDALHAALGGEAG